MWRDEKEGEDLGPQVQAREGEDGFSLVVTRGNPLGGGNSEMKTNRRGAGMEDGPKSRRKEQAISQAARELQLFRCYSGVEIENMSSLWRRLNRQWV
ncbi:MAG: hypothetical protein CMP31_04000 [Roseibacillus sp.]|nr:hypothetical protein [Roseibacillus sp.]